MIHLHWAVHSHQPVGNFDFIFERAFAQAYGPFLDVLASHPRIRMSMHFSGILLDWLEARRPEYLTGLRGLVERGQVEILGGGFYEPILPVISDAHKVGQLRKLQDAVKRLFGVTPRGLWLAERVWEPTLVKPISEAGLEFVVLDGSHFKMVGKTDRDMDGYFLSEDQGYILKLFPIHDVIRDYIPFRPVEEVVDALLQLDPAGAAGPRGAGDAAPSAGRPGVQVVFGDDGEKFGDWPGTHNTVFADRWLHRFFEAVEGLPGRIRVETLESGLKPEKNLGLVYLPPASYQEMMVWAQDARDIPLFRKAQQELARLGPEGKFLRGTFWRNFFNKYPESNQMHKQGIRLSALLDKAGLPVPARDEAREHIWQSQCNCGYWHGVFGGLYLPHLRFALYRHLIEAQKVLDGFSRAKEPEWEVQDWNCDGKPEYTLNTPEVFLSFTHAGEIDQFWLKGTVINLVDTLTRRYEAYHEMVGGQSSGGTKLENQLAEKESNLRDYLVYDQRLRHSLADLFLEPGTDFRAYARQEYRPLLRFDVREVSLRRGEKETAVCFLGQAVPASREEAGDGEVRPALQVEKTVSLRHGSADLRVDWRFRRPGGAAETETPLEFRFASENLFCLLAGNAPDRYVEWDAGASPAGALPARDILASRGEMSSPAAPGAALKTPGKVALTDEWLKLRCEVRFAGAARAWRDALETVSQSEGGYERVYQGTVVAPVWDFRLAPGGEASAALSIQIREAI